MMKILHLDLKPIGADYAEFRYFWDNPNDYKLHQLAISEISELIERSETDYYTRLPEDYIKTGRALYNWLDGSERRLQIAIDQHWREGIVLAIAASQRLAHLPWELLHDGNRFLVERRPAIVPVRWVADHRQLTQEDQPQNRALNVLFMATSPLGIEPELDFEAEEGRILQATKQKPLSLIVEESGCLTELGHMIEDYERGHFDVVHLTGHAKFQGFMTETEVGEPKYSNAEDIASELQFELPKLIFLSGCRTGFDGDYGTIRSMAEELLVQGATAVLGWGQNVGDTDATVAAASLYQELSAGKTVTEAVALTYQELIRKQVRGWHLLRLYVAENLPGALVKRGQKPVPRPSTTIKFVDAQQKLRVVPREEFVGRRRQLQNCLRFLKTLPEKVGVLIHGMGGLGKSAVAARLCDRFPSYEKIVLWRQIDEAKLVDQLAEKLKEDRKRTALKESQDELRYRLRNLFAELNDPHGSRFLLVLDDFEWNLEPRQGKYILKPEVATVLEAVVWAIQETNALHRIIITCRYDFESDVLRAFGKQPLGAFRKSELQKKLNRLEQFCSDETDKGLVDRALELADGNPRLLEWLNDEILKDAEAENKLAQLEDNPEDWRDRIIWKELYQQIDETIAKVVSYCLVFDIPVPMSALEVVCDSIPGYKEQLSRAIKLGLIEVSPLSRTFISGPVEVSPDLIILGLIEVSPYQSPDQLEYRVSRILPHIIPSIDLSEVPNVYSLYRKASEELYQLWGNKDNKSEEKWEEIFLLAFANRENPQRFRQGFEWMLEVQRNEINVEPNWAFITVLRWWKRWTSDLTIDHHFPQLEEYLKQEKWKEADEETAWIFYQVMVENEFEDWNTLLEQFPCEDLRTIDQLWVKYSQSQFGFSVQKRIFQEVGGIPEESLGNENSVPWSEFCTRVGGWWGKDRRRETGGFRDEEVANLRMGSLPAQIYSLAIDAMINTAAFRSGYGQIMPFSALAQRLATCSIR